MLIKSMLEFIRKTFKESGELMIKTSDGGKDFELHLHNTDFDEKIRKK